MAELTSKLLRDMDEYPIRKKTKTFLRNVLIKILGTDELPGKYHYKSMLVNVPKLDATMHVIEIFLSECEDKIKPFRDVNISIDRLRFHLSMLDTYARYAGHCVSPTPPTVKIKHSVTERPWETSQVPNIGSGSNMPTPDQVAQIRNGQMVPTTQQQQETVVQTSPNAIPINPPNIPITTPPGGRLMPQAPPPMQPMYVGGMPMMGGMVPQMQPQMQMPMMRQGFNSNMHW